MKNENSSWPAGRRIRFLSRDNLLLRYIHESVLELKKVKWPTRKELINNTVIVIISITIATALTAAIDWGLSYLIQYVVSSKG